MAGNYFGSKNASASDLDRKIAIESVQISNERGIAKREIVQTLSVWAKFAPLVGWEKNQADGNVAAADVAFLVRWSKSTALIKAKDLIYFADDNTQAPSKYEIVEPPQPIGYHRFVSIKARLVAA